MYGLPLHLPHGVRSPGLLGGLVMALLPNPTPPQVRALANVPSNLFQDAPPPPPPAPADPGRRELGQDGRDPVFLHCGAWYRPAAGEPAGCPACGSQKALHLPAAGDERRNWCHAFGDLALARLRPIGAIGLAPRGLHALLGVLQPRVQVLSRSLHRLGTNAPSYPLVVGVWSCAPGAQPTQARCSTPRRGGTMTPGTMAACAPVPSPWAPNSPHTPWCCNVPAAGGSERRE